jgi:hypothetical protein
VQVDVFGDEGVGTFIDNTLKVDGGTSALRASGSEVSVGEHHERMAPT